MKELSKEKLIEWLDEACECWKHEAIHINEKIEGDETREQIRKLIEEKPKATRGFIEGRVNEMEGEELLKTIERVFIRIGFLEKAKSGRTKITDEQIRKILRKNNED